MLPFDHWEKENLMKICILCAAAGLGMATPAVAATYTYHGSQFTCSYAYDLNTGEMLDGCPTGEVAAAAKASIEIDETKVPGGSLAGLTVSLSFDWDFPAPAIPEYLISVSATSPLYFGGGDRSIFELGYGKPAPWLPGMLYLKFDEAENLISYYMGLFIEYDSMIASGGDAIAGFLTRSPTGSTDVVAYYHAPAGYWERGEPSPVPLPAAGSLLLAGLGLTGAVSYRKARARG
ncbi:hypothetical protein CDV49_08080 [Haematobacter genomosp. 1]|uniref:PEP-CTERM protein-sorting domain-containing protein n=2 Tax=Haematobacter genomosp. 1 TaxID=366618 RepID=A0A212ADF2_9RHOB|nr:hypothetical protein CDV49_08080 [Haematobacter genomosp. 1]